MGKGAILSVIQGSTFAGRPLFGMAVSAAGNLQLQKGSQVYCIGV
jgi:hypothetical protein